MREEPDAALVVRGDMRLDHGVFVADFDAMMAAANSYVSQFESLVIETEDERKQAARFRAGIREKAREINQARIELSKAYDAPKDEFKRRCDDVIGVLSAQADEIDRRLKEIDRAFVDDRTRLLSEEYETFAPALMDAIPLSSFTKASPRLLGRSWTDAKARRELCKMIQEAVANRKLIADAHPSYAVDADAVYCKTLNVSAALAESNRLADQAKERVAHAALSSAVPASCAAGSRPDAAVKAEPVGRWSFAFTATRAQAQLIAEYARSIGVKSGAVERVG